MAAQRVQELDKLLEQSTDPGKKAEYAYKKLVLLKMLNPRKRYAAEIEVIQKLVDEIGAMCTEETKNTWKKEEIDALRHVKREHASKALLVEDYSRFWSLLIAQTVGYSEAAIREPQLSDKQEKAAEGELAAAAAAAAETTEAGFLPDYPRRLLY